MNQYRMRLFGCILVGMLASNVFGNDSATDRVQLTLRIGDRPFANYVYKDPQITRPYFCSVHSPSGIQVTRNHPVQPGDKDDHQTMHPGIWLSFGDLNGNDYWRLKATTEHVRFVETLFSKSRDHQTFTVENAYKTTNGNSTVCSEICRYDLHSLKAGTLLIATSDFTGEKEFYFGDQEEMGLGVRLATPISVDRKQGGRILDSERRLNGDGVWGKQAAWCDYSGSVSGKGVGITLLPSPRNFRASWWHARDYGFVAANPFGKAAFEKGEKSKTVVKPGTTFRVQFGIFIHDELPLGKIDRSAALLQQVYEEFKKKTGQR
ncbi:DUF6807 family protein [Planctomycetota bacterium]